MQTTVLCRIPLFLFLLTSSPSALEFTVCAKRWESSLENKVYAPEIDMNQYRTSRSLLEIFPGVIVSNEGGMTRVSIRGAKTDQTLVLINGIPVNDPSDPNNAFDFSTIETEDIEEIKIYTGAEALEYGSSAIGGVVAITTKKGRGNPKIKERIELGSSQTANASASTQGEQNDVSYYLNMVGKRTGRGSRFNPLHGNDVSDFNKEMNAEARLGTELCENWHIELFAHADRQKFNFDGFPHGDLPQEVGNRGLKKSDLITLNNQVLLLNQCWLHTVDISHMDIHRRYRYAREHKQGDIEGQQHFLRYETVYKFTDCFKILAETGWKQDETRTQGFAKSLDHSYLKFKAEGQTPHQHFFTLAGRIDKTQKITPHKTIQATAAFCLIPDMILKANAGTGFRAPSLQDIFGFPPFQQPNFNLKPEQSKTAEIGIENDYINGMVKSSLTAFYNRIHHIIVWVPSLKQMINRNHRLSKGIEGKIVLNPHVDWSLETSYTLTKVHDYSPKHQVIRQPEHKATFNVFWNATSEAQIFGGLVYESSRPDRTFLKRVRLPSTMDVRVGANYQLYDCLTLFGRVENLLDQKREKNYGYGQRRRGLFLGIKMVILFA